MVSKEEISYLLHMLSVGLNRGFTPEEKSLWLALLKDRSYDELHEAVTIFLKTSNEYLKPATILEIVEQQRKRRLQDAGTPSLDDSLSYEEHRKQLQAWVDKVTSPPKAPPAWGARPTAIMPSPSNHEIESR